MAAGPAVASQTACTFASAQGSDYYEIEFIGYDDRRPVVVFSSTAFGAGRRIGLAPADYRLTAFSRAERRVDLAFRNPRDPALPPSFSLSGEGGRARLVIGTARIEGDLQCAD